MKPVLPLLFGLVLLPVSHAQAQPVTTGVVSQAEEQPLAAGRVSQAERQSNGPGRASRPEGRRWAGARVSDDRAERSLAERINANTVSVISGTPGGTYFRMASDMAFAFDDGENLRVLPILGKGAGQNAYDIRFLKGVDLGFVRTDTLAQIRDDKRLPDIERHLAYVARLFNDELHVIAPREITDISQLAGKKVSFDVAGSGSDYTGRAMFAGLGIQVDAVNVDQPTAFALLKKGDLAAVVSVAAKPVAVVASFDGGDAFHLLDVPRPDSIADRYFPASFKHEDYARLVPEGASVNTLAVGTILGVFNWPRGSERYQRIARFIEVFFTHFDKLLEPQRHPKWKEVNLFAEVPGWQRFAAAEEWIARHNAAVATNTPSPSRASSAGRSTGANDEALYQEFLRWRQRYGR